uniref:Adenine phosphoribosyltransferase n=1 Tax=Panagrolaimus superbus TaxID=310955 RepID=A0A914YTY0_9BILA
MSSPTLDSIRQKVDDAVLCVPDFPKPGILFRDIMPIFKQPKLVSNICSAVASHLRESFPHGITAIAGLEARGFLFGPQIAILLDCIFVPIRKLGKLPGATIKASYVKEYGVDTVEIQQGILSPNDTVVIVDDLIATGGTMRAAMEVIEATQAKVIECFVLIELEALEGVKVLPEHCNFVTLLKH